MNLLRAILAALRKPTPPPPAADYDQDALYSELERDEDVRPTIYQDSLGIWTYGVGHNGNKPLSPRAIRVILEDDVRDAENDLDRIYPAWRTDLSERRKRVLLNLMFNMGLPRFGDGPSGFPKFWRAAKDGMIEEAALELIDSKWYGQVKSRGPRIVTMWREG